MGSGTYDRTPRPGPQTGTSEPQPRACGRPGRIAVAARKREKDQIQWSKKKPAPSDEKNACVSEASQQRPSESLRVPSHLFVLNVPDSSWELIETRFQSYMQILRHIYDACCSADQQYFFGSPRKG